MEGVVSDRLQYALSSAFGAFFGAMISLIVDSALFEIGSSVVFSTIFGLCLCIIGGILMVRVRPRYGDRITRWRCLTCTFSCLVLLSGAFCFMLTKGWLLSLTPMWKLPMYIAIGTSLCFALTFSIVDLFNSTNLSSCQLVTPLVKSSKQVYVVMISSIVMGFMFGFSFGMIDVEDDQSRSHVRLDSDQAINTALGALVGALMGGANQYLRDKQIIANSPYVTFGSEDDHA